MEIITSESIIINKWFDYTFQHTCLGKWRIGGLSLMRNGVSTREQLISQGSHGVTMTSMAWYSSNHYKHVSNI